MTETLEITTEQINDLPYTAPTLVAAYRQQAIQERGFARLKTRNLHIRPVYLSDERRIAGLTWLLGLLLRVLVS